MVHTNLTISIITLNVHVLTFAGGNMIPLSYHRKDIWGIHTKEGGILWQDLLEQKERTALKCPMSHP